MDVMPTRMVSAGQIVFREGEDPTDGLYYICYGTVEISRHELNGTRTLGELSTGDVFGEVALINNAPRNATITAKTDCGFYTMNRSNFQHRVDQLDPIMRGVFRVLILTVRDFLRNYDEEIQAKRKAEEGAIYEPVRDKTISGESAAPSSEDNHSQF